MPCVLENKGSIFILEAYETMLKPLKRRPCVCAVNLVKLSLSCDLGDEMED